MKHINKLKKQALEADVYKERLEAINALAELDDENIFPILEKCLEDKIGIVAKTASKHIQEQCKDAELVEKARDVEKRLIESEKNSKAEKDTNESWIHKGKSNRQEEAQKWTENKKKIDEERIYKQQRTCMKCKKVVSNPSSLDYYVYDLYTRHSRQIKDGEIYTKYEDTEVHHSSTPGAPGTLTNYSKDTPSRVIQVCKECNDLANIKPFLNAWKRDGHKVKNLFEATYGYIEETMHDIPFVSNFSARYLFFYDPDYNKSFMSKPEKFSERRKQSGCLVTVFLIFLGLLTYALIF